MIARADNTGLGHQTWELYRHLNPHKTLVVDISHLKGNQLFPERYPDAKVVKGFPTVDDFAEFLDDLDVVFTCEIPYGYVLFELAEDMGVKTILQFNYEFLDYLTEPHLPKPTLFAAPSIWCYDRVPFHNKCLLPVPVATDRFATDWGRSWANRFLHVVGRPASWDRNGTVTLLGALQWVRSKIALTITCQDGSYVSRQLAARNIPENVRVRVHLGDPAHYWELYRHQDVLVLPRRYGGLCLPAQEALAAEMPVVMPNIEPNGWWCEPSWMIPAQRTGTLRVRTPVDLYTADESELAALIDRFASDPAFMEEASAAAAKRAQQLSWTALRPIYQRLLVDL